MKTAYGGQRDEEQHQDYRSAIALAAIGKPAVEGLRGLLKGSKDGVRAEVVMGLGRIGPEADAAIPELVALLADKNERIRREASLRSGGSGRPRSGRSAPPRRTRMRSSARRAVEGLGYVPAPSDQVRQAVLNGARDKSPEVRAAAVKSLARVAPAADTLLGILPEILGDEDEAVRLAAIDLLVERRAFGAAFAPAGIAVDRQARRSRAARGIPAGQARTGGSSPAD